MRKPSGVSEAAPRLVLASQPLGACLRCLAWRLLSTPFREVSLATALAGASETWLSSGTCGSGPEFTGTSRGIGLAIARLLLSRAARILVNGYDAAETDATVASLRQQYRGSDAKPKIVGLPGDVTDPALATALVDQTVQAFGRIDHPGLPWVVFGISLALTCVQADGSPHSLSEVAGG
jgi:hypothetical protein